MNEEKKLQQDHVPDEVSDKEQSASTGKLTSRRAFAASIASLGAAALMGGKAEAQTPEAGQYKSKILDRIKTDLADQASQAGGGAYQKVGGTYVKGAEEDLPADP